MREGPTSNKVAVGERRENKIKKGTRILCAAAGLSAATGFAQIATDGTLGPRQSFTGNSITIPSAIGRHVNGNLFHSFQVFNVAGGQAVTFLPTPITLQTPTMNNIIARVTGGTPSTIQGTVRSTAPGVNLYLINPSGLVIGFDALIDVNGSFYASTAHYLRSADGTKFESRGPGVSLTFTTPDGFGFDSPTIAPVTFQGGILRVREGATLGIVGGALLIGHASQATTLQAQSGRVLLVGAASPGVVAVSPQSASLEGFGAMADVTLQSGATVNINEGTGRTGSGSAYVRGGNVTIDRGANVTARTTFADGRLVDIEAAETLAISQGNLISVTTRTGNAGAIRLAGRNITLTNAIVDTSCDPGCTTGNGGHIEVRALESFRMEGTRELAGLASNSFGNGHTGEIDVTAGSMVLDGAAAVIQGLALRAGDASAIRIHAGDITLRNGAQVDASSRGAGRGGQIVVDSTGAIRIEGMRIAPGPPPVLAPSGFFTNAESTGNAGGIVISTRTLEVLAGGEISSSARVGSTGQGGSVSVIASESVRVAGADEHFKSSGILTNTFGTGNAGEITLAAPLITISDGGKVQSQSDTSGRAGGIRINARDLSLIGHDSQISSSTAGFGPGGVVDINLTGSLLISGGNAGIFTTTFTRGLGAGPGGEIVIEAGRITIDGNGGIFASSQGPSGGGNVSVHATDSILIDNLGFIGASAGGPGDAGSVSVRADRRISIAGGGRINTVTEPFGGAAGTVVVHAGEEVVVSGSIVVPSGQRVPSTITSGSLGAGRAGSVDVRSDGTVNVADGALITTSARSTGNAGSVRVSAHESVNVTSGAGITSEALAAGHAGSVDVRADSAVRLSGGGRASTSTTGTGNAGTVTLFGGNEVSVSSGGIIASESGGPGHAGSVDVRSDGAVRLSGGGRASTSTTGAGNAGTVTLFGGNEVNVSSGASIASESSGAGIAGNLDVRSGGVLAITDGGRITTAATFSDGGNIHIESPQGFMDDGRITTAVGTGQGNGGNMEIRIPTFVLNNSTISANAFGGDGGNIHIATETFFKSANSSVTASSTLGVDGTITLDSPAIDPAGQLLPPSPTYLDAGAVLAGRCGARLAGRASSLVIVSRAAEGVLPGGLHTTFDGTIASPWYVTNSLACEPPRQ